MARPKAPSLNPSRDLLREVGLRCTAPRLAALQFLQNHRRPLSHGELVEALADREFDAATIYRNLIDLERAGLLSRVNLGDNVWRFELHGTTEESQREHPHFVCLKCGEVTCLAHMRLKLTPATGSPRSIVNSISEVLLKGQCVRCA